VAHPLDHKGSRRQRRGQRIGDVVLCRHLAHFQRFERWSGGRMTFPRHNADEDQRREHTSRVSHIWPITKPKPVVQPAVATVPLTKQKYKGRGSRPFVQSPMPCPRAPRTVAPGQGVVCDPGKVSYPPHIRVLVSLWTMMSTRRLRSFCNSQSTVVLSSKYSFEAISQ